jgi:hypothetical protein
MFRALGLGPMQPNGSAQHSRLPLADRETANPTHPARRQFSLRLDQLSPYAFAEILQLTDAQPSQYLNAYDATKTAPERLKIFPSHAAERE